MARSNDEHFLTQLSRHIFHVVPLHHIFPYTEVLINLVFLEKIDLLQLFIHVFFSHPLLSCHEVSLLPDKLSNAFAADSHVLLFVSLIEWHYAVVIRVTKFIKVEEI